MENLSKAFFALQVQFASILAQRKRGNLPEIFFKYTTLYPRLVGYPLVESNPLWQRIIHALPKDEDDQSQYMYELYKKHERIKQKPSPPPFGCFAFGYHKDTHTYELHFEPVDQKGNLGKERMTARIEDLQQMFAAIKKEHKDNETLFVTTWLLNIEAFTRLFPKEFIQTAQLWRNDTTQFMGHWGQFLDRHGNVKEVLAEKLLEKATKENHTYINEYFPLPAKIAQAPLSLFFEFYHIV